MNTTTTLAALKPLTDDQLASLYTEAESDALKALVIAEASRRDQCERERAARHAVNAEWFLFAHNQYLAAEAECRGELLNRAGEAAGIDPWSLWSGPASRAEKYASEELRDFWQYNSPRMTVCQYAARVRQSQRAERAACTAR